MRVITMLRPRIVKSLNVAAAVVLVSGIAMADDVYLASGQKLTNVQVVSKNWKGYEVQLAQEVTIFFERAEIENVEYDRIEPGRAARRARANEPPKQGGAFRGQEVSPLLGERLQQPVNVSFEGVDIRDIVGILSDACGIEVKLHPSMFGPGGLEDILWTVKLDEAPFIKVIERLLLDKGLQADLEGDVIQLSVAGPPPPPGAPPPPPMPMEEPLAPPEVLPSP
jgi:hypothetical protein